MATANAACPLLATFADRVGGVRWVAASTWRRCLADQMAVGATDSRVESGWRRIVSMTEYGTKDRTPRKNPRIAVSAQLWKAGLDNPFVPRATEKQMSKEMGVRTPHTESECLKNAEETQRRADSYRKRGWIKAAESWDASAARWRERSKTAPQQP